MTKTVAFFPDLLDSQLESPQNSCVVTYLLQETSYIETDGVVAARARSSLQQSATLQ